MIIDTSAILAILQNEPERVIFSNRLEHATNIRISSGALLETSIIIDKRFGYEGKRDLDLLLSVLKVDIVPFDQEQVSLAINAYKKYGKGNHPAGLNFGDCFSYALAICMDEPLLFKGDDFSKTDVLLD